ncbi:hypothetical protein TWF730_011039 [Orbilia blumenaviensis]|uniref:UVR domain-containing protein n=1 Tax=Orbilia blumenaviensis TaxID=1796055 RepID=A0AAV9UMP6_9PEZI
MCQYRSNLYLCHCYVLKGSPANQCQGPRDANNVCPIRDIHPLEVKELPRVCGRCEKIRIQQDKIAKLVNDTIPLAEASGHFANAARARAELQIARGKLEDARRSAPYN